jgi:hypothetical protein
MWPGVLTGHASLMLEYAGDVRAPDSTVAQPDSRGPATYCYRAYGSVRSTACTPVATLTYEGEQTYECGLVYPLGRIDTM